MSSRRARLAIIGSIGLISLLSATPAALAESKTIWVLLDTSKSMEGPNRSGRCGTSCQSCATDHDCAQTMGPDFECTGSKCRVREGREEAYCSNIWDRVKGHLADYLKSLNPGDELALYTLTSGRVAKLKLDATVHQDTQKWIRKVEKTTRALLANANCTYLYDSIFDLLDKEEFVPGSPTNHRRILYVFTDGVDEGSKKTAADLKALLNQIQDNGDHWFWQGPAPEEICPPGTPNCGDGPTEPGRVRIGVGKAPRPLNVFGRELPIELVVTEEVGSMFPYELDIRFEPDAQSKGFLSFQPSPTPVDGVTPAKVRFRLEPDFARKRPETLGGTLHISKRDGIVELANQSVPVSFAVSRGRIAPHQATRSDSGYLLPAAACPGAYRSSVAMFPKQAKVLANDRGADQTRWVVKTDRDQTEWKAQFTGTGFNLVWDGEKATTKPRREVRQLSIVDRFGWVQSDALIVPVEPQKDAPCFQEQVCDDLEDNDGDGKKDCDDPDCAADPACESSGLGWLLFLLALLAAAAAFFFRKPDMANLRLKVQWPDQEDPQWVPLCDNQMARFGTPTGRTVKGLRLAEPGEWRRAASGEAAVEAVGDEVGETQAAESSQETPNLTVSVVDGEVRLEAPNAVFVREPRVEGEAPKKEVVVAVIESNGVRPKGVFRVQGSKTQWRAHWRGKR